MDIGRLIKKARIEKDLTQEELAERVGVKKSAVAKWENGRVSEIKRSNLKKLADTLDLAPTILLGDIEENPVDTANKLADWYLGLEYKDDDLAYKQMIHEYHTLDSKKQAQVQEYVHLLAGKN